MQNRKKKIKIKQQQEKRNVTIFAYMFQRYKA